MSDGRLDIRADARRAFETMREGGIAILPMDVGYAVIGCSGEALERIFVTKKRAPTKYNAMLGGTEISRELHDLTQRQRDILEAITVDQDLPLGVIGKARMDHPMLRAMDQKALTRSTHNGTVCMLLNAGPFHAEITRLSLENLRPLFGSSANLTMQGTKFRVEDIEDDIKGIADVVIDYGLRKYHPYRLSSTLLDLETMSVVRYGSCFDTISDILKRQFDIELPQPA
jgi:tRNA A37 threonylcarbamoyladenosine synthetase subunit TsaC/SUA5/YrdC